MTPRCPLKIKSKLCFWTVKEKLWKKMKRDGRDILPGTQYAVPDAVLHNMLFCLCRKNSSGCFDPLARDALSCTGITAVSGRSPEPSCDTASKVYFNGSRSGKTAAHCTAVRWWHMRLHACAHTVRQSAVNKARSCCLFMMNNTQVVCWQLRTFQQNARCSVFPLHLLVRHRQNPSFQIINSS